MIFSNNFAIDTSVAALIAKPTKTNIAIPQKGFK